MSSSKQARDRKFARHFPLQGVLIVPFVLQIFAAVGLTGYISLRNGQKAINDLATQLKEEVSDRIQQNVDAFLDRPHNIHDVISASIKSGNIDVRDLSALESYFWYQNQTNLVPDLVFANPKGEIIGVKRKSDGSIIARTKNSSTAGNREQYILNKEGRRTQLIQTIEYNPLVRPWYQAAIQAGQPTWSEIYPSTKRSRPEISAVRPIYNKAGNLLGVLGSELTLEHISALLRNLEISTSGQAFIMEQNGALIASSTAEEPFEVVGDVEVRRLTTESRNPLTQATARHLLEKFGSFERVTDSQNLDFTINGERQLVRVAPLKDGRGIDWLIVVVVPKNDFMAQINANTRTTILLCLGALGLAILLGFYTSRWIMRPVLRLNQASEAIASGELNQHLEDSTIGELNLLSHSFNRMAEQLRESFAALAATNKELEIRVEERTADLKDKNEQLARALENLKTTQQELIVQEKLAALGSLTAGIAHEINTPLGISISAASAVEEDTKAIRQSFSRNEMKRSDLNNFFETTAETSFMLLRNLKRAAELVRSFKQVAVDQSSEQRRFFAVKEYLEEILTQLKPKLKTTQHTVKVEGAESLRINSYPGAFSQIITNLVFNSLLHAYELEDSGLILIHFKQIEEKLVLTYSDNGKGIEPKHLKQIFDPFFTTKRNQGGSGLGLHIVYNLATQRLLGTIECDSQVGVGTTFTIKIPMNINMVGKKA